MYSIKENVNAFGLGKSQCNVNEDAFGLGKSQCNVK